MLPPLRLISKTDAGFSVKILIFSSYPCIRKLWSNSGVSTERVIISPFPDLYLNCYFCNQELDNHFTLYLYRKLKILFSIDGAETKRPRWYWSFCCWPSLTAFYHGRLWFYSEWCFSWLLVLIQFTTQSPITYRPAPEAMSTWNLSSPY